MRKKTLEWMLAGVLLSAPGVVKGGPSGRELLVNANTLRDQGLVMQAETAYRQALSAAERTGAPLGEIAIILNNLGQVLRALGRYGEAEPVLVRSLEIKRQTVGGRDADVAITLNNLA
jgi:tetratricopeptide (TPR) repeat protein